MLNENNVKTGITSEVLTVTSSLRLFEVFNTIIVKKAETCMSWFNNLLDNGIIALEDNIVIVGTYFTGVGLAKALVSNGYVNVTIVDIYSHLEELIYSPIGGSSENISFSTDLSLIEQGDIVIDTTGFGGLSPEFSKNINCKAFLIEDPVAEDNDIALASKNNISQRLDCVSSKKKAFLKSYGLNTKTSGTMTLGVSVLTNSISAALNLEGVLYSACEMRFFEDIIFKEKDIGEFVSLLSLPAFKVSTIKEYDFDEILWDNLDKIVSNVVDF